MLTTPPALGRRQLLVPDQAGAEQLPRPRRLAAAPGRPHHLARVLLGLGQPVHPGGGHRTSVAGGRPLAPGVQRANTWANVLSDTTIQEVRLGYSHFDWKNALAECRPWPTRPTTCSPALTVGQRRNYPQEFNQNTFSGRYDLTVEHRHARPEVRRRVPALARHRVVGTAVARRVHLQLHAGRPGRAASRPTPGTTRPAGT